MPRRILHIGDPTRMSGHGESNPGHGRGKPLPYHWTIPADFPDYTPIYLGKVGLSQSKGLP